VLFEIPGGHYINPNTRGLLEGHVQPFIGEMPHDRLEIIRNSDGFIMLDASEEFFRDADQFLK
jgi:hypothetical protein